jgi:pimeloyl-ACP methyl ester carboxylesterase
MPMTRSADGTLIAFDEIGQGPALLLVDGALCHRGFGPMKELAGLLSKHFTVYIYDRRGRGESSDTAPWALEREVEDIMALLAAAGGSASVMGLSSGAALALEAARSGAPIRRLALYEAPFVVDDTNPPLPDDYLPRLKAFVAGNQRGAAVKQFMRLVGVPRLMLGIMPLMPMWKKLTAVAPTLVYDISIVEPYQKGRPLPADRWGGMSVPTLVMDGGKSPEWMRNGMHALASAIPGARYETLPGQNHMVKARVLAPVLAQFFAAAQGRAAEFTGSAAARAVSGDL